MSQPGLQALVPEQPGIHRETLTQKQNKPLKKKNSVQPNLVGAGLDFWSLTPGQFILDIFKYNIILEKSFLVTMISITHTLQRLRCDYSKTHLYRECDLNSEDGFSSPRAWDLVWPPR